MALNASQIARMNQLLEECIDLDRAGRELWLSRLRPEDGDLEPMLREALLAQDESPVTLPHLAGGEPMAPGDLVGPYRLMQCLGAGGMAQVWLAERADGAYQREVALKIPDLDKRGDLPERFALERDILATLEHPHIARFYDAGVASDGTPYLALEHVRGRDLIAWADERRLAVPARLELFLQVLDAVQHAHERGVLHRDLKPSNILVTEEGRILLLDFGVARLLQRPSTLTRAFGQAFTPRYASPEQQRGADLTPATDIYSLGVVLYELLCGSIPATPGEDDTAPATKPPSTRVNETTAAARAAHPRALSSKLRGDLDAIVMKALATDPEARYESANALAADLRRYLAGESVLARSPTRADRAARFLRRHPAGAGLAAIALALAILLPFAPWERRSADSAPEAAARPGEKSIAVLPFVDLSEKRNQEYFADGLTEEIIDRLAHLPDLKVIARTSSFAFKGRNEDVRVIAHQLGVANLLEGSVRRSGNALRVTAQLVRSSDGAHLWSRTFDRDMTDVFRVQDEIATSTAAAFQATPTGDPEAPAVSSVEAYDRLLQGQFLHHRLNRKDIEAAIERYREAIAIEPGFARAWSAMANAYVTLGIYGWLPPATAAQRARDAARRALALDARDGKAYEALGMVAANLDWDWKAAIEAFRESRRLRPGDAAAAANEVLVDTYFGRYEERIERDRRNIERDPLDPLHLSILQQDLYQAGQFAESIEVGRRAVGLDAGLAGVESGLALPLLFTGRLPEALEAASKDSDENWRLATLPAIYWALGRRQEAESSLRELEQKYAENSPYNIAAMHAYQGHADEAFRWLDRAIEGRDPGITNVRTDPLLRNIHGDARFAPIVRRMHLDESDWVAIHP